MDYRIFWISQDKQGNVPMGEYPSIEAAELELPSCKAELLSQCLDDDEDPTGVDGMMTRAACLAGEWEIREGTGNVY
jgi:hypothetical protein